MGQGSCWLWPARALRVLGKGMHGARGLLSSKVGRSEKPVAGGLGGFCLRIKGLFLQNRHWARKWRSSEAGETGFLVKRDVAVGQPDLPPPRAKKKLQVIMHKAELKSSP